MGITLDCGEESISQAAKSLQEGHLVAFPTETVYGLGADATNEIAVRQIYAVKSRPNNHPLIVHISSVELIDFWAVDLPKYALDLARNYWPGPMTLILKKHSQVSSLISGGQENIGLRIPNNECALQLLRTFENLGGMGVVAPSANKFGSVSPTSSEDVEQELGHLLGKDDLVLNGGQCKLGIESTIVNCLGTKPKILRPGFITENMIEKIIEIARDENQSKNVIKHPGDFKNHYAPKTPVYLNSVASSGDGLIALETVETPENVVRLSSPKSLEEFASNLYKSFRKADQIKLTRIVVILNDKNPIADAIRDRVIKASIKN
jgi:L-threonylcarbamoyladenylate synthase